MERNINSLMAHYFANKTDKGRGGRAFECFVRWLVTGEVSKSRPMGIADIRLTVDGIMKTIECKSGQADITPAMFFSKEEAEANIDVVEDLLCNADWFAYTIHFDGTENELMRIYRKDEFIAILREEKLLRAHPKNGFWQISFQSFIPTDHFRADKARYNRFCEKLANSGTDLLTWVVEHT